MGLMRQSRCEPPPLRLGKGGLEDPRRQKVLLDLRQLLTWMAALRCQHGVLEAMDHRNQGFCRETCIQFGDFPAMFDDTRRVVVHGKFEWHPLRGSEVKW